MTGQGAARPVGQACGRRGPRSSPERATVGPVRSVRHGRVSRAAESAMTPRPCLATGGSRWTPTGSAGLQLPWAPRTACAEPRASPEPLLCAWPRVAGRSNTVPPLSWVGLCWAPQGQTTLPGGKDEEGALGASGKEGVAGNTRARLASSSSHDPRPPRLALLSRAQGGSPGLVASPRSGEEEKHQGLRAAATAQMLAAMSATGQRGQGPEPPRRAQVINTV